MFYSCYCCCSPNTCSFVLVVLVLLLIVCVLFGSRCPETPLSLQFQRFSLSSPNTLFFKSLLLLSFVFLLIFSISLVLCQSLFKLFGLAQSSFFFVFCCLFCFLLVFVLVVALKTKEVMSCDTWLYCIYSSLLFTNVKSYNASCY